MPVLIGSLTCVNCIAGYVYRNFDFAGIGTFNYSRGSGTAVGEGEVGEGWGEAYDEQAGERGYAQSI
ncbi:hypothetical protein HHJ78_05265 [Mobiluncus mulieris]|uniref:Uncharacterized protein n=1 Tax=Mobiluncus mulieris TaxID=2052 RepID=A0A7Y0Y4D2_9ACTO|nr:hypothetical protein [Mobiluncus mulieris]NMW64952.1 hypothetical protein [Mobiluncus mulieris]